MNFFDFYITRALFWYIAYTNIGINKFSLAKRNQQQKAIKINWNGFQFTSSVYINIHIKLKLLWRLFCGTSKKSTKWTITKMLYVCDILSVFVFFDCYSLYLVVGFFFSSKRAQSCSTDIPTSDDAMSVRQNCSKSLITYFEQCMAKSYICFLYSEYCISVLPFFYEWIAQKYFYCLNLPANP